MKVRNINGTSGLKCKCGSWMDHWTKFSHQTALYCSEVGCRNTDLVGAHVQKDSLFDKSWYIVPLCNLHNKATNEMNIVDTRVLVSANKNDTCDK